MNLLIGLTHKTPQIRPLGLFEKLVIDRYNKLPWGSASLMIFT